MSSDDEASRDDGYSDSMSETYRTVNGFSYVTLVIAYRISISTMAATRETAQPKTSL
jgi:hypothetical protein